MMYTKNMRTKWLAALSALLLTATGLGGVTASANTMGDIDGDGVISISDAYQALLAYANTSAGVASGLDEVQTIAADSNSDGVISITDAYYILLYYSHSSAGNNMTWENVISSADAGTSGGSSAAQEENRTGLCYQIWQAVSL